MDLDECAYPEHNTCAGGLNPSGIDIDVFYDKYEDYIIYLGDVDADGYSQVKGVTQNFLIFRFLAITTSNLHQIQKVRSVLKSAGSEDFKTVLTFDIWPNRSWENWV